MEKKFSEFTLDNSPAFIDQIVGLKGGDNSRTTLQSIYDLFQSVIGDVDPLPSGTYAKVMYYNSGAWGASNEFVTDGTAVTIGQATPDATAQLSVRDEGGSPKDYTTASINSNGSNVHTKHGISFFTLNGASDNINQLSNEGVYRALFDDGATIFKDDILIDVSLNRKIRYGDFHATTGNFTEFSKLYANYTGTKLDTAGNFTIESNGAFMANFFYPTDYKLINFGEEYGRNYILMDVSNADNTDKVVFNVTDFNVGNDYRGSLKNSSFVIGNNNSSDPTLCIFRLQNSSTTSGTSGSSLIEVLNNGNILMKNLPTSSAGLSTGTLWNNSGVLNIA